MKTIEAILWLALLILLLAQEARNEETKQQSKKPQSLSWVQYATGTEQCLNVPASLVDEIAMNVRTGDFVAVERYEKSVTVRCAAAHLIEDAGGLGRRDGERPDGDPKGCHRMIPAYRDLLRVFFNGEGSII